MPGASVVRAAGKVVLHAAHVQDKLCFVVYVRRVVSDRQPLCFCLVARSGSCQLQGGLLPLKTAMWGWRRCQCRLQ